MFDVDVDVELYGRRQVTARVRAEARVRWTHNNTNTNSNSTACIALHFARETRKKSVARRTLVSLPVYFPSTRASLVIQRTQLMDPSIRSLAKHRTASGNADVDKARVSRPQLESNPRRALRCASHVQYL